MYAGAVLCAWRIVVAAAAPSTALATATTVSLYGVFMVCLSRSENGTLRVVIATRSVGDSSAGPSERCRWGRYVKVMLPRVLRVAGASSSELKDVQNLTGWGRCEGAEQWRSPSESARGAGRDRVGLCRERWLVELGR